MRNFVQKTAIFVMMTGILASNMAYAVDESEINGDFLSPAGITVSQTGDIYVADKGNNNIVNLTDEEVIAGYTLPNNMYNVPAGGYLDNDALNALFNAPSAIIEWNGGLVVSDTENHVLRFIKDGEVTTIAGTGTAGFSDGKGTSASFNLPRGLTVDDEQTLYIADSGNGAIRTMTTDGVVTTLTDEFVAPCGLDWYENALYVTDMLTHEIFKLQGESFEVIAGISQLYGDEYIGTYKDGTVEVARFNFPQGIDVSSYGIAVADSGNSAIRLIDNGIVTTVASFDETSILHITTPTDVVFVRDVIYATDSFAGTVFTVKVNDFIFADGNENSWWMDSAVTLYKMGIINGVGENNFAPDDTLTRGMIATMLCRYAESQGQNTQVTAGVKFPDVEENMWYTDPVSWLSESKITTGYENGTFGVEDAVLRQDVAVFLYRYSENLGIDVSQRAEISSFVDANDVSQYASDAISWAVAKGILNGTTDNELLPTAFSSRAEATTMICNYMEAIN